MSTLNFTDVLYFVAEILVYVAVAWWGFTRDVPGPLRWCLALGLLVLFAVTWGLLASPRATFPLHGVADAAFRIAWFGLGAAAAIVVIVQRSTAAVSH
ncbi:hypothetical protein ABIB25_002937 [Nakamurella sp. UYEF19]|uniref:YrdB family protein n=1 Tax=Nakamurella sp. UYEF19 TaxID=1756392 RepID=UPI003397CB46